MSMKNRVPTTPIQGTGEVPQFDWDAGISHLGVILKPGYSAVIRVIPSTHPGYWFPSVVRGGSAAYLSKPIRTDGVGLFMEHEGVRLGEARWRTEPCEPHRYDPFDERRPTTRSVSLGALDEDSVPAATGRYVYFIQGEGGGPIKIGVANDPMHRMSEIQRMSPVRLRILAMLPGGQDAETVLHQRFRRLRSHGEWFRPAPDLLEFISKIGE